MRAGFCDHASQIGYLPTSKDDSYSCLRQKLHLDGQGEGEFILQFLRVLLRQGGGGGRERGVI